MKKLIFKLIAKLPLGLLRFVGSILGVCVWISSPRYRRRMRSNFLLAIDWAAQSGTPIPNNSLWVAIRRAGWMLAELPAIWCREDLPLSVPIEGLDSLEFELRKGRGLILLSPHLGGFELAPRLVARLHPLTVMYQPAKLRWIDATLREFRVSDRITAVPASHSGVRHFLRVLRSGGVVGILPDQVPARGQGLWVNFLGRQAYTMSLPTRLAEATNAPLAWVVVKRTTAGWSAVCEVLSPGVSSNAHLGDRGSLMERINGDLERFVLESPGDYLWSYNRYKHPRLGSALALK